MHNKPMKSNSRILLTMLLAVTVVACSPTGTVPPGVTGRIVFTSSGEDGNTDIYTNDLDGQNLKRLTDSPIREIQPKWSPDGKKIVFSSLSSFSSDLQDLYIMNADGSNQIRLNIAPYTHPHSPEWSPDGEKIVFSSELNTVLLDLQTGTLSTLSTTGTLPSWSPDGKKLVLRRPWGTYLTEYFSTINVDGTNQTSLSLQGELLWSDSEYDIPGAPSWSPDGKTIAFGYPISKYNSIYGPFQDIAIRTGIYQRLEGIFPRETNFTYTMIMQPDGSGVTRVTDRCDGNAWSPDSKWIICASDVNGNNHSFELYIVNVSSGNSFRLTDTPYNESDPDWAP